MQVDGDGLRYVY